MKVTLLNIFMISFSYENRTFVKKEKQLNVQWHVNEITNETKQNGVIFVSNWNTNCDYKVEEKCGDICIPKNWGCHCGNTEVNIYNDNQYCCVPPSPTNDTLCMVEDFAEFVYCENGTVVDLRKPCNGKCYNEYQDRYGIYSGYRAYFKCTSGDECVNAYVMCQGYSLCKDKSDVEACSAELQCVESYDLVKDNERHVLNTDFVHGHTFCSYRKWLNDGTYVLINRQDETRLKTTSKKIKISFESLQKCYSEDSLQPGLICNDQCRDNFLWCNSFYADSCKIGESQVISTIDKTLCENTTFWSDKTCNRYLDKNTIALHGRRCTGASQHCIYPWYLSLNYLFEVNIALLFP